MQAPPVVSVVRNQNVFPVKQGQCGRQISVGNQRPQNFCRDANANGVGSRNTAKDVALSRSIFLEPVCYLLLNDLFQAMARHQQR